MNIHDSITKETQIIANSMKDSVNTSLFNALKEPTLGLKEDQLAKVLSLISLSLDQSYQRALPSFQNSIKKILK